MTLDDPPGTVTICRGQGLFLRADDAGVLMRNNYFGRARRVRIAWTEISHFADGAYTKEGETSWMLVIVLRTGKQLRVLSSVMGSPDAVVAAIREAAQPRGIPADLAGVPTRGDRPAKRGLYVDPFGQPGLRYWDGGQWSPLLPQDVKPRRETVRDGPSSWSALPTTSGRWSYAATSAKLEMAVCAGAAIISASLLAWGVLMQLGYLGKQDENMGVGGWFSVSLFAVVFALLAWRKWVDRGFFLRLDRVANASSGEGPALSG